DVGSQSSNGAVFFEEEFLRYATDADAQQAVSLFKAGIDCTDATIAANTPATFSPPQDVTSDIALTVEEAFETDVQTEEGQGQLIAVRDGSVIVTFQFFGSTNADTSKIPSPL